jgi:hypothetical protein
MDYRSPYNVLSTSQNGQREYLSPYNTLFTSQRGGMYYQSPYNFPSREISYNMPKISVQEAVMAPTVTASGQGYPLHIPSESPRALPKIDGDNSGVAMMIERGICPPQPIEVPMTQTQQPQHTQFAPAHREEKTPVLVNAKQFARIIKRREFLKKCKFKGRGTYIHESRHLHTVRRPRGRDGRFLNIKEFAERERLNDKGGRGAMTPEKVSNAGAGLGMSKMLVASKIPVSGCGYVHDSMPADGVGQTGLMMKVKRSIGSTERHVGQVHIRGTLPEQDLSQEPDFD